MSEDKEIGDIEESSFPAGETNVASVKRPKIETRSAPRGDDRRNLDGLRPGHFARHLALRPRERAVVDLSRTAVDLRSGSAHG